MGGSEPAAAGAKLWIWRAPLTDDKLKWDTPTNVAYSKLDPAGELAKKHGISPDGAQMLIDRHGEDAERLDAAAKGVKDNLR